MNLHPVFIHFPIALFSVYALLEFIRFKKIIQQSYWFYVKAVLVIAAALGASAAVLAGDGAKEAVARGAVQVLAVDPFKIINFHENWADASLIIFALLAAGYLIMWLDESSFMHRLPEKFLAPAWRVAMALSRFMIKTPMVLVLAIAGLIAITITGALGGSIIYGPNADPMVQAVYAIFVR